MIRSIRAALALAVVLLAMAPPPAAAHGASDAWLSLRPDPVGVAVRWDIAVRDLDLLVGLDGDGNGAITAAELAARADDVARQARASIGFAAGGRDCVPGPIAQALARRADGMYAVLRFTADCGVRASRVDVDYRLLGRLDASHRAIVTAGAAAPQPLRPLAGAVGFVLDDSAPPASNLATLGEFLVEGLLHILEGIDHLAFVVALALAAVAVAARTGASLRATGLTLLAQVTLFTLAHSITLAGVALGWLALPSRWVESVIAASVALAGVQVIRIARGHGVAAPSWLVFTFGLVHGFGFGSALAETGLQERPVVAALLGFNLGVEVGQVAVLAIVFPLLWAARDVRIYRRALQPGLASVIVLAGALWFVERAFGLDGLVAWAG